MIDGGRRVAAIVGRPNVGKSALFNRIARRRIAIVHEQAGVTRDRLAAEVEWDAQRFELLDTGGIGAIDGAPTGKPIEDGMHRQAALAMEDAAVLIWVVDLRAGALPLDQEMSRILHRGGRPVIVAANKADEEAHDVLAAAFESFGFPVVPVSALHNRGLDDLLSFVLARLPEGGNPTVAHPLRVAVLGRPNAGKSSYINRLLDNDRVLVSEVPGTTRDSVDVPFQIGSGPQARHYILTDTAGIRRKKKVREAVDQYSVMRAEKSVADADVAVLMMDAQKGPGTQEKKIGALLLKENCGCVLVVSKWDLAEGVTQRAYGKALLEALPFLRFAPVLFVSSMTGYNVRRSVEAIDYVAAQVRSQLTTGVLNRVLHDAFDKVQPPIIKGRRLKFYYATQTGSGPIRIRLFVNNPALMRDSYRQYLVNRLRAKFGLEGAPVLLHPVPRSASPDSKR
jgi:GTPase